MPTKKPAADEAAPKTVEERPELANEEPLELAPTEAPPPPPSAADMLTPIAWAERLGKIRKRDARLPQSITFALPDHAAADALYGWTVHAYHFQAPVDAFLVTEETYTAALRSAMEHPIAPLVDAAIPASQRSRPDLASFVPKAARSKENG